MSKAMPKIGEFCWNELMTPDVKKAKDFYKSLFGWDFQNIETEHGSYTMIKGGENEKGLGGIMQTPADKAEQIPPHWMSYIYVENVDQYLEKAKNLGASITYPATNVSDYGRFAVIKDPTGAHIALWQSLKSC